MILYEAARPRRGWWAEGGSVVRRNWVIFGLFFFFDSFFFGAVVHLLSQGGGNDSAQLASERGVGGKGMNGFIYRNVAVMGVIDMLSATIVGA